MIRSGAIEVDVHIRRINRDPGSGLVGATTTGGYFIYNMLSGDGDRVRLYPTGKTYGGQEVMALTVADAYSLSFYKPR